MKTKPNKPTRSKPARHNVRAGNDKKPLFKYEAELFWTQHDRATVIIEARSREEAEAKADGLSSEDVDDWGPTGGEMFVYSIQLVAGGSDNE
jgi:hypothetical protein